MKILYYKHGEKLLPGIITDEGVIGLNNFSLAFGQKQYSNSPLTLKDLDQIKQSGQILLDKGNIMREDEIIIGPCVPFPPKIICIGLNYRKHAIESGMQIPSVPVVFTKYNNTLIDFGKEVHLGPEG